MNIQEVIDQIHPVCAESRKRAEQYFSNIAIPLNSLGKLQDVILQIASIQKTQHPSIEKRSVVVFCADNGVVAQGVTQCGQEVTAVVTENLHKGETSVCKMARHSHVRVIPVDIGVARDVHGASIIQRKIAYGTQDMTQKPAMTREACVRAILTGVELAMQCAQEGDTLLAVGEMGIGNTTTTAAVTSVLLQQSPEQVTGRGAGLSTEGLIRKREVISRAIALHQPNPNDPIDVLSKVGGFDLAGMVGLYLGAAAKGIPVVVDGAITLAAALCAIRLCPLVEAYLIFSHTPTEPAGKLILEHLQKTTFLDAGMHLGEGTGAVAAIALLDLAFAIYTEMPSFAQIAIDAYQPLR